MFDRYLKTNLEDRINAIFDTYQTPNQKYVLDAALSQIEPNVAKNFIEAYAGEDNKQLNILYAFPPNNKAMLDGSILVNTGALTENSTGLNNIEGRYNSRVSDKTVTEDGEVIYDQTEQMFYIQTSQEVGEVVSTPDLSSNLILDDEAHLYQNKIYLVSNSPSVYNLDGLTVKVVYRPTIDHEAKNHSGRNIGFQGVETGSIYVVSNNMNVLRCLMALTTFVLLTMRATDDTDAPFPNLTIHREGVSVIQDAFGIKTTDEKPIYAIKFSVETQSSYSVSYDTTNALKHFNLYLSTKKDSD